MLLFPHSPPPLLPRTGDLPLMTSNSHTSKRVGSKPPAAFPLLILIPPGRLCVRAAVCVHTHVCTTVCACVYSCARDDVTNAVVNRGLCACE